jgi:hypothetical protein
MRDGALGDRVREWAAYKFSAVPAMVNSSDFRSIQDCFRAAASDSVPGVPQIFAFAPFLPCSRQTNPTK